MVKEIKGKQYTAGHYQVDISLGDVREGVYLLKTTIGGNVQNSRIIKAERPKNLMK